MCEGDRLHHEREEREEYPRQSDAELARVAPDRLVRLMKDRHREQHCQHENEERADHRVANPTLEPSAQLDHDLNVRRDDGGPRFRFVG